MRFDTKAIHAGQKPDPSTGAIMPPVYLTSTFVQESPGVHKGYEYARSQNPTREALERNLAALEGARHGVVFASGLAAESALLTLLESGDHVVCGRDVYGGTYRLFQKIFTRFGYEFTNINIYNLDEIEPAIRPNTRLVWLESPSNPLLTITDLEAAAGIAHAHGLKVVVDNTFATPCLQRPLALGADFVIHSATKYLGGHSDVVGGAIITDDDETHDGLKFVQKAAGAILGPLDCFLILRGTKTLSVRMQRHCENAGRIARHLAGHPDVETVHYPGLESHPGHDVARRQMTGFGGMVSVLLKGGLERNSRFTTKTRLFALAESLGGVESLVCIPGTMTHAAIPPEEREKGGFPEALVRLSVGIEDVEDLIEDIDQAIDASR
jgi:cystathionine gamma-lyase